MKTYLECVAEATKDEKVKWPLDCGCKSDTYYGKCEAHQQEYHADQARKMGIVDLQYSATMFNTDQGRDQIIQEIKMQLTARPTKNLLIKLTPEPK